MATPFFDKLVHMVLNIFNFMFDLSFRQKKFKPFYNTIPDVVFTSQAKSNHSPECEKSSMQRFSDTWY